MKLSPKIAGLLSALTVALVVVGGVLGLNWWQYQQALKEQTNALDNVLSSIPVDSPAETKLETLQKLDEKWVELSVKDVKPEAETHYVSLRDKLQSDVVKSFEAELASLAVTGDGVEPVAYVEAAQKVREKVSQIKATAEKYKNQPLLDAYENKLKEQGRTLLDSFESKITDATEEYRQLAMKDPTGSWKKVEAGEWPMITLENDFIIFGPVPLGWGYLKNNEPLLLLDGKQAPNFSFGVEHPGDGNCYALGQHFLAIPPGTANENIPGPAQYHDGTQTSTGYSLRSTVTGYGIPPGGFTCELHKKQLEYTVK